MPNTYQSSSGGTTGTTKNTGTQTTTTQDPTLTTQKNLANIPGLSNLTSLINAINQQSQTHANLGRIANEGALETQSSQNIADALAGKVGSSTKALLGQETAESGIGSGMASDAAYLRLLGQTSEGLQGTGQQWLSAATARNPAAATYDPTTGLLTATQGGQTTNTTNEGATSQQTANQQSGSSSGYDQGGGGGGAVGKTGGAGQGSGLGDLLAALSGGGATAADSVTADTGATAGTNQNQWGTNEFASLGLSDEEYNSLFGTPENTTTTDTSSNFDPFAGMGGFDEGG